jgi:hypothetical protein
MEATEVTGTYRYRIQGARLASETQDPPEEIIEAESELNAADAYFHLHGKRTLKLFRRVVAQRGIGNA